MVFFLILHKSVGSWNAQKTIMTKKLVGYNPLLIKRERKKRETYEAIPTRGRNVFRGELQCLWPELVRPWLNGPFVTNE